MYNAPDPAQATLVRNDGKEFPKIADLPLAGIASKGNHLALKPGQPEVMSVVVAGEKSDTLKVESFTAGTESALLTVDNLPSGADYAVGKFDLSALADLILYKPGNNAVTVRPLQESGGKYSLGNANDYDLGKPVRRVVVLHESKAEKLFVIFGEGETAAIYNFNGKQAPTLSQSIKATNDLLTCAVSVPNGLVMFSKSTSGKFSNRYFAYNLSGDTYKFSVFGGLPTLADNDNITIPDIHDRIIASLNVKAESDMKLYTNSIPGTRVKYVMVPIQRR